MDLHVLVIGAVVFVVSAVLIYLISAFTMKEKTFEEVIAEQKRRQEEEREKLKQEKKMEKSEKNEKRKYKKKDKPKDKGSPQPAARQAVEEEELKEHKMVNLELEPEIIEPMEVKSKPTKKDKVAKPILHNREEKTPVSQVPAEEVKHVGPPPKDDLELKHEREQKKLKQKKEKQRAEEVKQAKPVVEEMVRSETSKVQAAAPPSTSPSARGGHKEGKSEESKPSNIKLLSTVQSANLSDSEMQAMMEILASKQGSWASVSTADWNKKSQKGDPPVALLRKQLEEKERALQEEQQMVMSANTKLKEMSQEKARFQSVEKSYKVKVDYQSQEIQALHNRMQQAHDQHMMETSQFRSRIQQLEGQVGDQSKVKMMAEENKILRETLAKTQAESVPASEINSLKQKVSIMETELSSNVIKLNASENAKKTLEQKVAKYEAEVKKFESVQHNSESAMEKRVEEVSQELRRSEGKNTSLSRDLQGAKKAVDSAHNEVVALKSKLQELEKSLTGSDSTSREMEGKLKEAERTKRDMEGNLKNLQKKIEDSEKDKSELNNEIKSLQQENSTLSEELKVTRERQQGEGQEAPAKKPVGAPNGDVCLENDESAKVLVTEYEKKLSDKDSEISRLMSEVETKKSDISALQSDMESQKKKNNELREKNWKAMDALEKSEKSVSEKVQGAKTEVVEEYDAKVKDVESFDKSVLQRLFPQLSVPATEKHKDWMTKFETDASNEMGKQKSTVDDSAKYEVQIKEAEQRTSELESRLKAEEESKTTLQSSLQSAEENCNKAQSQVSQYRSVLAETENKLTQLENSVESEEKKWQERLQSSQVDLDQVKEKSEELEGKLKSSEDRCSQLQEQISQAETKVSELQVQLGEANTSSASVTDVQSELDELRKLLEAEKKKNRDLAYNVVKLNGIIKTGHDALTQEQQLVEKLKKELANGSPDSAPKDSSPETAKMRSRIADLEKQVEKEHVSNKLLSQRLAASQQSLNEAGTSV